MAEANALASLYGGQPALLVSARLAAAAKPSLHGLAVVPFHLAGEGIALGRGLQALPGEVVLAFVADAAERQALLVSFAALGRGSPPLLERPTAEAATEAIVRALAQKLAEAGRREARLREALISMRWEAEETRAAMARLIDRAAASFAPQSLLTLVDDEPAPPADDLRFEGPFEIAVRTTAEIFGLSALALMIAPERVALEDRLEIRLRGEEKNAILGAWRIPLTALESRRDWLTLDLPVSLASARQSALIEIRGRLQPASAVKLARSAAGAPALRLYAARAPRLSEALYWSWPDVAAPRGVEAVALPGEAWTQARLIGGGLRVGGAARGEIRLRLPAGAGAMLIFPEVALDRVAGVAARLRAPGRDEIVAAIGLLPAEVEFGDDVGAVQEAGLVWSPLQSVRNEAAAVVLPVPGDAPTLARVVVALRNTGAEAQEAPMLHCDGLWLLRPPRARPPADFSTLGLPVRARDTAFDEARLEEFYEIELYSHLDLKLSGLSDGARRWPSVKFKLAREGNIPALEFRLGGDRAACFENWPGTQADDYGPVFKLNGPLEYVTALAAIAIDKDRRLLVALADLMPDIVRALTARGDLEGDSAQEWLALARTLRGWTL